MKDPKDSTHHISTNKFWSELAGHLANGKSGEPFLSWKFMDLESVSAFVLALCFLPSQTLPKYSLSAKDDIIEVKAESPFLVFVKEMKAVPFEKKFGLLINQRLYDPSQQIVEDEEGNRVETPIKEFLTGKVYSCQTVVTNTSDTEHDVQLLIDVPKGSVPIGSHEYTKIISQPLSPFSVVPHEMQFYFPEAGAFPLYPANVSKNSKVAAKADSSELLDVKDKLTEVKLETFQDVLRNGTDEDILQFLADKNIFDNRTFNVSEILWMLRKK